MRRTAFFCALLPSLLIHAASDIYVSAANAGRHGLDGTSPALAYATIQDGVDAAQNGDTILVLPGDYATGGRAPENINTLTNRVGLIGLTNVTVRSTNGKAVTRIIGAKSPDSSNGLGSSAVRCLFTDSCRGIRIQGFTLLDGATKEGDVRGSETTGGALYARDGDPKAVVLADCTIQNCSAMYGGAVSGATLLRTWITDCSSRGAARAAHSSVLVHCLVTRCTGGYAVVEDSTCINCTIAENSSNYGIVRNVTLRNTAVLHNGSGLVGCSDRTIKAYNCVFSGDNGMDFEVLEGSLLASGANLPFVAPLFDDYRPVSGSALLNVGSSEAFSGLDWLSDSDRRTDLAGRLAADSGCVSAGCFQESVTPQGGAIYFPDANNFSTRGKAPLTGGLYAFAETYPTQFLIHGVNTLAKRTKYFSIGGSTVYPLIDDSIHLVPPAYGKVLTNKVYATENVIYVDKASGRDGDAAYDGKSPDRAFRTIQAGVDAANGDSVVVVAEGEYDEGGRYIDGKGVTNRVVVSGKGGIRIVGAGAGRSVIRGKLSVTENETYPGCGTDAIRCVYVDCSGAMQGFTLADGRVLAGTTDVVTSGGALFAQNNLNFRLTDSIITNCTACRGFAFFGGDIIRCQVVDCGAGGYGALARYSAFTACLFVGNNCQSGAIVPSDTTSGSIPHVYACTFVNRSVLDKMISSTTAVQKFWNCIFTRANAIDADIPLAGCVVNDSESVGPTTGFISADPQYANPDAGDYRPFATSPVLSAGEFFDGFSAKMIGDVNGGPLRFVDGNPAAGAVHSSVAAIEVASPTYGEQSYSGRRALVPGETLVVAATDGESRHCIGFNVNGEDLLSEPAEWRLTLPETLDGSECYRVAPIYSTKWYVNASGGDDGNTGFTPATAKRTLKAMLSSEYLLSGDTVHAAPGTYGEGEMEQLYGALGDSYMTTPARACIKEGVTLMGDAGAEHTVICGNTEADGSNPFGKNPVRCVNLTHGARIIGFTLTGGSTAYLTSASEKNSSVGGAVIAPKPPNDKYACPVIQDCIISNNCASRGGAAFGGTFVNCRIVDNYSISDGTALYASEAINCLIDRNRGSKVDCVVVRYPCGLSGVTITDRNVGGPYDEKASCLVYNFDNQPRAKLVNSIVMGVIDESTSTKMTPVNCLVGTSEELGLTPEGCPLAGSAAIDAGSNDHLSERCEGRDVDGGQRCYNGRVDIGCFEYDWRGEYSRAIGGGAEVLSASEEVVLEDGGVTIPDGASITGVWPKRSNGSNRSFCTVVALTQGGGTLSGTFHGVTSGFSHELSFVGDSGTEERFSLRDETLEFAFAYSGEGMGSFSLERITPGFSIVFR